MADWFSDGGALNFGFGSDLDSTLSDNIGNLSAFGSAMGGFFGGSDGGGSAGPVALPVANQSVMVRPAGKNMATLFPALAAAMVQLSARYAGATIPWLLGLLRKYGPQFLIAQGIVSSAALMELLLYKSRHKHRRMNSLNPKALTRSIRRLSSFERKAAKVSAQLGRVARKGGHRRRSAGRCVSCRSNPCKC